jgi:hypothetical protein
MNLDEKGTRAPWLVDSVQKYSSCVIRPTCPRHVVSVKSYWILVESLKRNCFANKVSVNKKDQT